ncbi:MAG: rhomboid family intramembrane serine protease [Gammaproteobacteria bacterium]
MLPVLLEIYRSARSADCEERAFVLTAVGIPSLVDVEGGEYVIWVDAEVASAAQAHLDRYALESRPAPPPPPSPVLHPFAWVGCVVFALVLITVGYAVAGGAWRLDAFDVGALDAGRMKSGEWWRAWTALTLHVDASHLATNLGAGIWFGYLAGRQMGGGILWLLAVLGAGVANLLEGLLGPSAHRAVGASTAVFAVLGIMAAFSWRDRFSHPQRWARRWGPLIAGVLLLGWLGSEGEHTDVVGHVAGFFVGVVLGAVAAAQSVRRLFARVPQWVTGGVAVGVIAVAWIFALGS